MDLCLCRRGSRGFSITVEGVVRMRTQLVPMLAAGVAAGAVGGAVLRYRRDMAAAWDRLEQLDRHVVATRFGAVEYAERGTSTSAVLVSHGAFQGCDGGLAWMQHAPEDQRVIAPSRFGYLGSSLPAGATAADQADAFVELLDHLGLQTVDVLGLSAGTSAAVQMALRHPDRVGHMVIMCGVFPGGPLAEAPPGWTRMLYSEPVMWLLSVPARPVMVRGMGVPEGFPRDADDAAIVDGVIQGMFPFQPRAAGLVFDSYTSNPEITGLPLEEVAVPTLIVHAVDDTLASYDAAAAAAARIPGARLVSLDSGGHLMLGQTERVGTEMAAFLSEKSAPLPA